MRKRIKLACVVLAAGAAPLLVGAVYSDISPYWNIPFLLLILWLLFCPRVGMKALRITVVLVTLSVVLTGMDLLLRSLPFLKPYIYYRPNDMYNYRLPAFPELLRYKANVSYEGKVFGDLVAISGKVEARQWRNITFRTDALGFRNAPDALARENDLILLGDSFGVGMDTAEDKTWSGVFEKKYGVRVYNLSMPANPWAELVTLKLEYPNLKLRDGAVVLWALFGANDLDKKYGDPWSLEEEGFFKQARTRLNTFRKRSVIRQLISRIELALSPSGEERVISRDVLGVGEVLFFKNYIACVKHTLEEVKRHKNYRMLEEVFASMKAFAHSKNLAVAVVLIPSKPEIYSWVLDGESTWSGTPRVSAFNEAAKKLCEKNAFPFLDLKEDFIEEARKLYEEEGELLWWRDDTHWNDKGHGAAAKFTYEKLLQPLLKGKGQS